jgi:lipopolysaccharide transport system ATP-binding protein
MSDTVIIAEGLSKLYRIGLARKRPESLADAALGWLKTPVSNFRELRALNTFHAAANGRDTSDDLIWALRDISFEVKRGDVLGIIGRNGAGKSTLLKVLSRITRPTSGRARMRGRLSALLEVGTGFHPELTGRQNIYLNGTILGMRKREIDRKFDEIVDFSGVERFLDTPVKRYSSGMHVRLAFSVAAHLEPDIIVIDEVLAVGDAVFQRKCLGKMGRVATEGRTVLFVSHNMQAVRQLCRTALWLSGGTMKAYGPSDEIVSDYLREMPSSGSYADLRREIRKLPPDPTFRLHDIEVEQDGRPGSNVISGSPVEIIITYEVLEEAPGLHVYFELRDLDGTMLFESYHNGTEEEIPIVSPGKYVSRAIIPSEFLAPTQYELRIGAALAGVRCCVPSPICVALDVEGVGVVNRAYAGYRTPGKLAPLIEWETQPLLSVPNGERMG